MGPPPLLDVVFLLVWTGWIPYSFGSNSTTDFKMFFIHFRLRYCEAISGHDTSRKTLSELLL
jgi:hypothetical protein